jgi:hypothetical protein
MNVSKYNLLYSIPIVSSNSYIHKYNVHGGNPIKGGIILDNYGVMIDTNTRYILEYIARIISINRDSISNNIITNISSVTQPLIGINGVMYNTTDKNMFVNNFKYIKTPYKLSINENKSGIYLNVYVHRTNNAKGDYRKILPENHKLIHDQNIKKEYVNYLKSLKLHNQDKPYNNSDFKPFHISFHKKKIKDTIENKFESDNCASSETICDDDPSFLSSSELHVKFVPKIPVMERYELSLLVKIKNNNNFPFFYCEFNTHKRVPYDATIDPLIDIIIKEINLFIGNIDISLSKYFFYNSQTISKNVNSVLNDENYNIVNDIQHNLLKRIELGSLHEGNIPLNDTFKVDNNNYFPVNTDIKPDFDIYPISSLPSTIDDSFLSMFNNDLLIVILMKLNINFVLKPYYSTKIYYTSAEIKQLYVNKIITAYNKNETNIIPDRIKLYIWNQIKSVIWTVHASPHNTMVLLKNLDLSQEKDIYTKWYEKEDRKISEHAASVREELLIQKKQEEDKQAREKKLLPQPKEEKIVINLFDFFYMYKNDLPKSKEYKKYETFKKKYCSEIDIAVEPKTDDANQDQRRCVLKNEKEFKELLQIVNTSLSLGNKHQQLILKKLSEDSFQNEYIIKIINKDGDILDIPKSVGQGGLKKKYSKKNLRKKKLNIKKFFSQRKK